MKLIIALVLIGVTMPIAGCSRKDEDTRPALERAQEKLQTSMDAAEEALAEGKAEARKALAAAMEQWDELRPEAEKAIASLEERVANLVNDTEALERLPPDVLEKVRNHLDAMRQRLEEAKAAHEQGNTDLAVEKADAVQQEREAVEELLVERPDPPTQGSKAR